MPQNHEGYTVDAVGFIEKLDKKANVKFGRESFISVTTSTGDMWCQGPSGLVYSISPAGEIKSGQGFFEGSTFGGSMIMLNTIVPGAFLEVVMDGKVHTTSAIVAIESLDGTFETWYNELAFDKELVEVERE